MQIEERNRPPSSRSVGGVRTREMLLAALACTGFAAALVLLCASVGALGASRNDDWVYYRALFDIAGGRPFSPNGWSVAFLAGQDPYQFRLNNISSESAVFSFGDPNSSILITTPSSDDFRYVVMPMRI